MLKQTFLKIYCCCIKFARICCRFRFAYILLLGRTHQYILCRRTYMAFPRGLSFRWCKILKSGLRSGASAQHSLIVSLRYPSHLTTTSMLGLVNGSCPLVTLSTISTVNRFTFYLVQIHLCSIYILRKIKMRTLTYKQFKKIMNAQYSMVRK